MKSFLTVICLIISPLSFSQGALFGITGGPTFTGLSERNKFGPFVGSAGGFSYTKFFGSTPYCVTVDAIYNRRGAIVGSYDPPEHYLGHNYIAMPVRIGFLVGERAVYLFNAGVVPALMAGRGQVEEFDLGVAAEAGAGFYLRENLLFTAALSGQHGFSNYSGPYWAQERHYNFLSLNLSLKLKLRKGNKKRDTIDAPRFE
jgi:hypothetical protein